MQTQTSNTLHSAIMEAGSKDHPPMLAPGIDNDIYSTVDACPNACEMWKAIERFYKMMNELIRNQCKVTNHQVNVQFLLQLQPEWQRAEKIARVANPLALIAQQQPVYHPQHHPTQFTQNSSTRSQQVVTRNRGKAIVNSPQPIYDQESLMVDEDDETSKDKEIDKLMALISLSFKKIYKPTSNNLRTSSNTSIVAGARETVGSTVVQKSGIQCYNCKEFGHVVRECHKPKRAMDAAYHREKMLVSPDAADSGPIFDDEVSNDDHYNVFAMESTHPEQSKYVHDTYPIEQDTQTMSIDSLDMSYGREEIDQNDDDNDLAKECELLASLIKKLKCEIDESKNRNKFLETSNKVLIEKLKGEIEDLKNKNKSLESSNNFFKEANNRLSETNNLLYADYKKSEAELARRNSMEYVSQVELECAKVRGDLLSYKMDYLKSCTKYTDTINALTQTISKMKDKISAHQETISILSKQKEPQIKLYKTRTDKELDKVIELENKVKVLDNIVYKTGQSVQTMNMLSNKCQTSFAKPEFLKKAQRANPCLYDMGCYNDNLVLMLTPDSDEVIRLKKESRSKLSDLIRPFDYDKLNSLEYYYVDHMNAILGVYTELDEVTNLQCDYLKLLEKCEGVILTTSVSKPQLKSNPHGDRVMQNNSQGKKQEVEDHRRSVKLSKNKTSVTACNDSLNAKTLNVKSVSAIIQQET
nr:hypothetical protein [Tanacetum cinerariifolium]